MFATHLESTADGSRLPLDRLQNTHGDRPLLVRCLVALRTALRSGQLGARAEVVVFNTGAAQKYVEAMQVDLPRLRRDAVDWGTLAAV